DDLLDRAALPRVPGDAQALGHRRGGLPAGLVALAAPTGRARRPHHVRQRPALPRARRADAHAESPPSGAGARIRRVRPRPAGDAGALRPAGPLASRHDRADPGRLRAGVLAVRRGTAAVRSRPARLVTVAARGRDLFTRL